MTRSFDLDRPKLVPNFVNAVNGLTLATTSLITTPQNPPNVNTWLTFKPGAVSPGPYPQPQPLAAGAVTDFQAGNQWVNMMAALGR